MLGKGIAPGSLLATEHADLFWPLVASMWVCNAVLLLLNVALAGWPRAWAAVLAVPYRWVFPALVLFAEWRGFIGPFFAGPFFGPFFTAPFFDPSFAAPPVEPFFGTSFAPSFPPFFAAFFTPSFAFFGRPVLRLGTRSSAATSSSSE